VSIQRFRTIEEMNAADEEMWLPCGHPDLPRRVRSLWSRWSRLVPVGAPPGIRRYRSVEEADADRDRWESDRIERIRGEHLKK